MPVPAAKEATALLRLPLRETERKHWLGRRRLLGLMSFLSSSAAAIKGEL
jgi:hypothetical protein